METGRVERPVRLLIWSRFFDRPVKPVETPVKFSFLATKRHLSTNRNIHLYFTIHKFGIRTLVLKTQALKDTSPKSTIPNGHES